MKKLSLTVLAASLIALSATAIGGNVASRLEPKQIMATNNTNDHIYFFLPRSGVSFDLYPHSIKPVRDPEGNRFTQFELWDYKNKRFFWGEHAIICDQGVIVIDGAWGNYTISRDESRCN